MRFTRFITIAALLLAAAVLTAGSVSARSEGGAVVKAGHSSLGRILVDSHGKTLYLWAHDHGRKSTCYGECAEYWPPLLTSGSPRAASGARAALLGMTRRVGGGMQGTYKSQPPYYFAGGQKARQTPGERVTGVVGRWDPVS